MSQWSQLHFCLGKPPCNYLENSQSAALDVTSDASATAQVRHLVQEQQATAVLMAYGISAAGKTYTIEGTRSDPGLLPRALDLLFQVWLPLDPVSACQTKTLTLLIDLCQLKCSRNTDCLSTLPLTTCCLIWCICVAHPLTWSPSAACACATLQAVLSYTAHEFKAVQLEWLCAFHCDLSQAHT